MRFSLAGDRQAKGAGINPSKGLALALPPHLADQPNFLAAARHSRRVRFLRRAIPWTCAAVVLFLLLRTMAGAFIGAPGGLSAGLSIQDRKVVMEKPRLSGFKRDGSTYEMNAEKAIQDLKNPNLVEMVKLTARIQQGAQGWTNLSGNSGFYDSKIERLDVRGDVRVKTESGTEALLQDALIEFKAGTVITEKPVEVKMATGEVSANRMQVLDNGRKFVFEGNVRSEFVNATPAGQ
ncbi:MAG: LPS export ABC transporter periplasmic protein LptC [Rhabdaerophilum sp.]